MKYWTTIGVTVLILVAVLLPGSKVPDVGITGFDKLAHVTLFFLWSLAVRHDFTTGFNWIMVWVVGVLFSISTEILQLFAEDRSFDLWDMLADAVGLSFGLITGAAVLKLLTALLQKILNRHQ